MPELTRRRSTDAREECWHIYYGDMHAGTIAIRNGTPHVYGANAMRSVLALGLSITLCASADAATVHRSKPHERHLRPSQPNTAPKGYAVPGWTDEQTRYWLDNATGPKD
jgi:hypothetical protein